MISLEGGGREMTGRWRKCGGDGGSQGVAWVFPVGTPVLRPGTAEADSVAVLGSIF